MANILYSPDGGEEVNKDYWMRILADVNRCGDEMLMLAKKYGQVPFSVNIEIFHEHMPDSLLITVERLKYINTKFKEQAGQIQDKFKIHGVKGNE